VESIDGTKSIDRGLDLLALVVEHVPEHHGRILPDEQPRLGRPLPARPAAGQRELALESSMDGTKAMVGGTAVLSTAPAPLLALPTPRHSVLSEAA
jgi:hypothetical protein